MSNTVTTTAAGSGLCVTNDQTGAQHQVPGVVLINPATGLPYAAEGGVGGGATGGLTNTELRAAAVAVSGPVTDAQMRAAALPVSVAALPLPAGAATAAAQATAAASLSSIDTNQGAKADVRATWYDSAASLISLLKLSIAAYIGAGSHAYGYTGGQLTTDTWTLFGVTRTKTYTYTAGILTEESDWM